MKIDAGTIDLAFFRYGQLYGKRWPVSDHLKMLRLGEQSFIGNGDFQAFSDLYNFLDKNWQVFRARRRINWSSEKAFSELMALPREFRQKKLSDAGDAEWGIARDCINRIQGIKTGKGPSLTAISKFLHFWNPRLFVIVDQQEMQQKVFGHQWLKAGVITNALPERFSGLGYDEAPLDWYLRVLCWSSTLIRENPFIGESFTTHLGEWAGALSLPFDIRSHESVAVEWLLLGLVEIPPPGVEL